MVKHRHALFAFAMIAGAGIGTPAQAATGIAALPLALAAMASPALERCTAPLAPALGEPAAAPALAPVSKASAILGGQVSQLELLRMQQEGRAAPAAQGLQLASATLPGTGLVPQAGPDCARFVVPDTLMALQPGRGNSPLGSDEFLASKRLPVSRTSFDAQWSRVSHAHLSGTSAAALRQLAPGRPSEATLAAVNAWANQRIRYVEDRDLYGRADYWADARQTLRKRAGDCEDIAIAKLQLLEAMGVPAGDMYLTIARDLVRNADHALLVVRMGSALYLLDNATDRLLDARQANDYRPILSYSEGRKYLHGY